MKIIEVKDKKTEKAFLRVPQKIYANDPNWIPHLEKDIKAVFDPAKNPLFGAGELSRWILKDEQGNIAGRIAAFINKNLAYTYKQATGGIGFFECINDRNAAFQLFDTAKDWLTERGIKAMDGPINFGEKDRFWGLLVEGNHNEPPYLMNYNPLYYRELFEEYGFRNYYEQYVYRIFSNTVIPPILEKKFQRLTESQGYHFEHLKINQINKYAEDFVTIYNKAWSKAHQNFKPMSKEKAIETFNNMKHVVDEELVVFGYHNGNPVAFLISILELNQIFRFLNGKMNLLGKLKFLYHKWRGTCRVIYGIVFGVVPEYQNRGLESGLIMTFKYTVVRKNFYKSLVITWVGDFNPKMIRLMDHIGAKREYKLITYRKHFSDDVEFERHPVLQ